MENKTNFTDILIEGLRKTATELDELRLQLTLGSYEAKELYEQVKREFRTGLHEARQKLEQLGKNEKIVEIINGVEHLQVQLALGMAESEELFLDQKKKISQALSHLESRLKSDPGLKAINADLHLQIEKFRMKLELLALQFKLKKIKTEVKWEQKKAAYLAELETLRKRLNEKETIAEDRLTHFRDEMKEAFTHLRKAFQV
jgi:hypothetical protein